MTVFQPLNHAFLILVSIELVAFIGVMLFIIFTTPDLFYRRHKDHG